MDKGDTMNEMNNKYRDKGLLTVKEMCEYMSIGQNTARNLLNRPYNSFTVRIGNYELLKRIKLKKKKDVSIVFPSQADTYLTVSGIDCAIKNICNEINSQSKEKIQRFSAHTFRHTYAARCLENGINPKTVQYLLGHSSLQTTMNIYTHITMEQAKKEVLSVDIIKL